MKAVLFRSNLQEMEVFLTNDNNIFFSIGAMGEFSSESIEINIEDTKELIAELNKMIEDAENE